MDVLKDYVANIATERRMTADLVKAGNNHLRVVNDDLAHQTDASDGLVIFGVDHARYPGKAAALLSPGRRYLGAFGVANIHKRFIELPGTRVGEEYKRFGVNRRATHAFMQSELNPEQTVYTFPIEKDEKIVALGQFAFDAPRNYGIIDIGNREADHLLTLHKPVIEEATFAVIDRPIESFELGPATTPTAYVIRWDIRESTRLATGKDPGLYLAYKQAMNKGIEQLIQPFENAVANAGDGQNIVIYLPATVQRTDSVDVQVWGRQHIPRLLKEIEALQSALAEAYELNTTIRLSVDVGNVFEDPNGQLDGDGFSLTAKQMKERPSVPITYTERASFLERTN